MPATPTVSVVVCTRDRPEELERCLRALSALTPPADEILVVNNSPDDERAPLPSRTARFPSMSPVRA